MGSEDAKLKKKIKKKGGGETMQEDLGLNKKSRTYGTSDLSISISFAKNHMRGPLPWANPPPTS